MSKRLLLVGSNTIHLYNYLDLVSDYFDEVTIVTNEARSGRRERFVTMDFSYSLKSLINARKIIRSEILRFRPDVIHVHQANSYAFYTLLAARGLKIPVVITAWGSDILVAPKGSRLIRKVVSYCLRKSDYLTSDSSYMAEEMIRLAKPNHAILIANFGIEEVTVVVPKENIMYSNRLHKKLYNVDKIILAFASFCALHEQSDWRLVVAATGEETDSLKALTRTLGLAEKVDFVGWLSKEENARWYARARCWISIPDSDATSISLLEAMAHGCIPIVSDLPANREWIRHGENGWIVKAANENFLSEMQGIDEEKARAINRRLMEEKGTKAVNREKFISLYDRALKNA
jgi:glycosyltransferase involved in cell wall biosynthesis